MPRTASENLKPVAPKKELSGYEKAQKRKQIELDNAKQSAASAKWFKPSGGPSTHEVGQPSNDCGEASTCPALTGSEIDANPENLTETEPLQISTNLEISEGEEVCTDVPFDSSDPSTWKNPIPTHLKNSLTQNTPVQKYLPHYKSLNKFQFQDAHYLKSSKAGETTKREWLLYSERTNSLFCFPCCLFGGKSTNAVFKSPWMNYGVNEIGFSDFGHQSRGISTHEESQLHFHSVIAWKANVKAIRAGTALDFYAIQEQKKEASFWKEVLRAMLDAVLFLAKNNLAFRGSSSKIGERGCGNFLSLVELLSHYHPPLALHIQRLETRSVSYMSHQIQNEFIGIMGATVRRGIIEEVKSRHYFSILFDATPDVSHKEQISQIIRTIKVTSEGCSIEENFVDFIHFDQKTGEHISQAILDKLQMDGLNIQNCRGQGYDNGSNMKGIYKGVQARIRNINPLAHYIPCPAHSLNLVGHNAASKVLVAKLSLGQIQNLYQFFSASPSRWTILKKYVKKTLKCQSGTRWSSKAEAVTALYEDFGGVIDGLLDIINDDNTNSQTLADANSNFNQVYNFKFLLSLTIWDFILCRIQIVNLALQKKESSISSAEKHLRGLLDWLSSWKENGYEISYEKAKSKASELGLDQESGFDYRTTRSRLPTRYQTDATAKATNETTKEKFQSEFFNKIITGLMDEFQTRFDAISEVNSLFQFLWGKSLEGMENADRVKHAMDLALKYPADLNGDKIVTEILYLKSAVTPFLDESTKLSRTSALDILNILTCNNLQEQFENCHVALRIFLTIPVTVASNERSFSKLKIIKNYLRASMGQDRLSDLAILSIEHEYAENISFDNVIHDFAESKSRQVQL